MNLLNMMGAMQNPQGALLQYAMQGMIAEHPAEWQKTQEMFSGKSRNEQLKNLRKLYKDKGMNLDMIARQYGVQL